MTTRKKYREMSGLAAGAEGYGSWSTESARKREQQAGAGLGSDKKRQTDLRSFFAGKNGKPQSGKKASGKKTAAAAAAPAAGGATPMKSAGGGKKRGRGQGADALPPGARPLAGSSSKRRRRL